MAGGTTEAAPVSDAEPPKSPEARDEPRRPESLNRFLAIARNVQALARYHEIGGLFPELAVEYTSVDLVANVQESLRRVFHSYRPEVLLHLTDIPRKDKLLQLGISKSEYYRRLDCAFRILRVQMRHKD